MKTVDINEKRAEKKGEITQRVLISHLLTAIENGEIEHVVYVAKNKDGIIDYGCDNMPQTEIVGLLECGKLLAINDMYEE